MDIVLYHGGGCADGFCSAWLAHKVWPDAEYLPCNYGDALPNVAGKDVLIVDFSYPREVLTMLAVSAKSLTLLDHHKTAEADLQGFMEECHKLYGSHVNVVFDMEKSGARLMWDYLCERELLLHGLTLKPYEAEHPINVVRYVEDRDLWKWKLPNSREVNAAIRSYDFDFKTWDRFEYLDRVLMAEQGRAILRYQDQIVASHLKHAREIEFCGHKVLCANATSLISEIAGALAQDRAFGMVYFDRQDGLRQFSLRSREGGVDVSEIAQRFGGGGHRNAAGFAWDTRVGLRPSDEDRVGP